LTRHSSISRSALAAAILSAFSLEAAPPTARAAQPAYRADQFTDFVGLSASPFDNYQADGAGAGMGTKYPPSVFFDLGVRHYRASLKYALTPADAPKKVGDAYDRYGAQAMLLIDALHDGMIQDVVGLVKQYPKGSIDLIEGPNECNNKFPPQELNLKYGGKSDEAAGAAYMNDLYPALKADPATRDIGVVSYTAIFTDYHLARPCASFDYSNMHSYQGYNVPEESIEPNEVRFYNLLPANATIKPFIPTECGYNVEADISNGTKTVGSLRAQALNIPMLLAEYFRHGLPRTYLFALHNADGYGLLESDQATKRPSYYALKSFLSTIKDADWDRKSHRWVGGDFTPRALIFSLKDAPSTVHTLVLQKKSGRYLLMIWNEVRNYDQDARKDIINPAVPVTLNISTSLAPKAAILTQNATGHYDTATKPIANGKLKLDVPASVMFVELDPRAAAPASVPAPKTLTGTATGGAIRLAWPSPASKRVAGYFVYRNGEFLSDTRETRFEDTSSWIRPGLGYSYAVRAYDSGGNMSAPASAVIVTPNRRPNLVCTNVEIPTVHAGEHVAFRATLKNIGDGPTPPDTVTGLTFFVDGKYTAYYTTNGTPLHPGQSVTMTTDGGPNHGLWTATAGAHLLRVQVDDIDRVPTESRKDDNNVDRTLLVDVAQQGELIGNGDPAPGSVDLTAEGTEDWAHWGQGGKNGINRKSSGGHKIGDLTYAGSGYCDATPGFGIGASWTDGAPVARQDDTHASLWLNNVGYGYRFTAPADTSEHVLRVYAGGIEGAGCTLTAHLSDGSAPDYVSNTFNGNLSFDFAAVPDNFTGVYTLRYRAASPGQTLTVTWALTSEPNRFLGQARLQAATLARK